MTNATSRRKRALEEMLDLPPKALKSPPGFAKGGNARRGPAAIPSEEEFAKMSFVDIMAKLSERKARFVTEILKGTDHGQAIANAGWNCVKENTRRSRATYLLRHDPWVMAAIKAARKEVAAEAKYELKDSFDELKQAMAFAEKSDNATAYVRAVELRAKLFGLLVERQDVRNLSALSISISGLD